jgi:hypothetical protein
MIHHTKKENDFFQYRENWDCCLKIRSDPFSFEDRSEQNANVRKTTLPKKEKTLTKESFFD